MRRCNYWILEAIGLGIFLAFATLVIVNYKIYYNIFAMIFFGVAAAYCIAAMLKAANLIFDIIKGPVMKQTTFFNIALYSHLDIFPNVKYKSVYFNDDELTKNYIIFDDVENQDIKNGEKVIIKYYRKSRIVINIDRTQTQRDETQRDA